MRKLLTLLALVSVASMSVASVVTDINQAPGTGGNIDLTAGSYITWGYDADSLTDGFSNYKSGTSVAVVSDPNNASTRDYGYTFTFNDGNSPGSGTAVTSSGGIAGLLADGPSVTFSGIVSSAETRRLTLYLGGYASSGSGQVDLLVDATLKGGTADETGAQKTFVVDYGVTTDVAGLAIATYTVDFTSATESDLVIDFNYANVSGTRNWGLSGYTVEVIPEPATMGLVAAAGLGALFVRRRFLIG